MLLSIMVENHYAFVLGHLAPAGEIPDLAWKPLTVQYFLSLFLALDSIVIHATYALVKIVTLQKVYLRLVGLHPRSI